MSRGHYSYGVVEHLSSQYIIFYRRHCMSEAVKDDELLDDDLGENTITRFTDNWACIMSFIALDIHIKNGNYQLRGLNG